MDEEVATATATEASMLVLKTTTNSAIQVDDDDLNVNVNVNVNTNVKVNSTINKIKMGIAAASVSVLVIGGTTMYSSAGFRSSNHNINNINNDITVAVEMNLLRTSTNTNTAEATTTITANCCEVADGIFKGGDALENCYQTSLGLLSGYEQCWTKSYFKNGDTEACVPQGSGWDLYDEDKYGENVCDCGSPCTLFASNTC